MRLHVSKLSLSTAATTSAVATPYANYCSASRTSYQGKLPRQPIHAENALPCLSVFPSLSFAFPNQILGIPPPVPRLFSPHMPSCPNFRNTANQPPSQSTRSRQEEDTCSIFFCTV